MQRYSKILYIQYYDAGKYCMFYLFNNARFILLIYVDMITYKEKDKLVSYIISTGLVDFIIDCELPISL